MAKRPNTMLTLSRACRAFAVAIILALIGMVDSTPAGAHGLAQRYELPIPLGFYLAGAAAAVGLSFLMVAMFFRHAHAESKTRVLRLPWLGRVINHSAVVRIVEVLSLGFFVMLLVAGFSGNPSALRNILTLWVWIAWWVGFAAVSALLGNVWPVLNPWAIAFRAADTLAQRVRGGRGLSMGQPYPSRLGAWPAALLYLGFIWMELAWTGSEHPASLARAILAYSIVTWLGMAIYGAETWLQNGEVFSVFFGVLGRFAPFATARDGVLCLRPPGIGLVGGEPKDMARLAFVILMLSSVTYDGLLETPLAADAIAGLSARLEVAESLGIEPEALVESAGLIGLALSFLVVYGAAIAAMTVFVPNRMSGAKMRRLAFGFILSLVPIAIAYHTAHNLWFFVVAGQYLIPAVSDPLGLGWDLFGTTLYRVDIGLIDARGAWYAAVTAIVLGHVLAVYVAHRAALGLFDDARTAVLSQIPMLGLMIGYTMTSLWILAQPIVA
jgi:hypothetical protein